jgi:hypothetical protein
MSQNFPLALLFVSSACSGAGNLALRLGRKIGMLA